MEPLISSKMPVHCPACQEGLSVTRLQCASCGTEVAGAFALSRLAALREPHASLIELFLRVRGNVKEMERETGLSYPTVRARLEDALAAIGLERDGAIPAESDQGAQREQILQSLEKGEITPAEATDRLRELKFGRG